MEVIEETTLGQLPQSLAHLNIPLDTKVRVTIEEIQDTKQPTDSEREGFQNIALLQASKQLENESVEYTLDDVKERYE